MITIEYEAQADLEAGFLGLLECEAILGLISDRNTLHHQKHQLLADLRNNSNRQLELRDTKSGRLPSRQHTRLLTKELGLDRRHMKPGRA